MGELNSTKPRLTPQEVPQFSQYAARSLNAMTLQSGTTVQDLIERFQKEPVTREAMRSRLEKIDDPEMLDMVMRQLRREVMTTLIVRDLTAHADFHEVVGTVTALAEETVSAAVRVHSRKLAQRFGVPLENVCMVGDRLYTDIALGACGCQTALVLCGETSREDLARSGLRPTAVCRDLAQLGELVKEMH